MARRKEPEIPDPRQLANRWVFRNFGTRGLVVLFALGGLWLVWTNRSHLLELPIVRPIAEWISREPLPHPDERRFSVLVANLGNDQNHEHKALILDELNKLEGVQVLSLDREIKLEEPEQSAAEEKGHGEARKYLVKTSAHILLWGRILRHDGKAIPKLYWATSQRALGERYAIADFKLPEIFWTDLSKVLSLLVAQQNQEFSAKRGHFVADRLKPFIDKVRPVVSSLQSKRDRAKVLFLLAGSLLTYGDQIGSNKVLGESITSYREVLKIYTRELVPLDWALTQNNLGNALSTLGERENGTARLEEAVNAYREALMVRTRERSPLDWAMTQNNLGNALSTLGERENRAARLEEAVNAYREALMVRTRERSPFDWAMTQNNLGAALLTLDELDNGTTRHEEAVNSLLEALKEYTRERVPLQWAAAQNNLGTALSTLGGRESGTARLEKGVNAYREALKERTRERVPLDWAITQNNLGTALSTLGERERSKERLCASIHCYLEALSVVQYLSDYHTIGVQNNLRRAGETMKEMFGEKALEECKDKRARVRDRKQ